jgi:cell division protein FtsQ
MKEKRSKILGTFIFLVLISSLFFLIFFSQKKSNNNEVKMIELTGNHLLSAEEYLNFAKLVDQSKLHGISLSEIKARFERHPYVKKANVEYAGGNVVRVILSEKKIEAVLLFNDEPKFISNQFQILPVLPNTKFSDLPIISNLNSNMKVDQLSSLKSNDLIQAFKIIDAAKLTNEDIFKKLSEINLRNGGDILLTFSGIKPPVIFGKGEAAKKMVYLDIIWNSLTEGNDLMENSDYIDLRFANEIFIGASNSLGTGNQKSGFIE